MIYGKFFEETDIGKLPITALCVCVCVCVYYITNQLTDLLTNTMEQSLTENLTGLQLFTKFFPILWNLKVLASATYP
jgi:hypothetical protein